EKPKGALVEAVAAGLPGADGGDWARAAGFSQPQSTSIAPVRLVRTHLRKLIPRKLAEMPSLVKRSLTSRTSRGASTPLWIRVVFRQTFSRVACPTTP